MVGTAMEKDYIFELRGITKTFPGVRALDNISFGIERGTIHALVCLLYTSGGQFAPFISWVNSCRPSRAVPSFMPKFMSAQMDSGLPGFERAR